MARPRSNEIPNDESATDHSTPRAGRGLRGGAGAPAARSRADYHPELEQFFLDELELFFFELDLCFFELELHLFDWPPPTFFDLPPPP